MTTNPMQTCLFTDAAPRPPVAGWRAALGRLHPRHGLDSLKGRLVLGALFALVVGMALTAWQMGQFAQAQMLARAQERELADARHSASILGHRVHEMQRALQVVGQQIDAATLNDPARLAAFFAHQPVLQTLYTSVFAVGADGRIRLLLDAGGPRTTPTSISDREYFQRAMATGRAVISDPIEGRVVNEPMIIFAQPLTGADGVHGVLAGSLRLASRDLLADMTHTPADAGNELALVSDAAGRLLAHPNRSRLLGPVSDEARLAPLAARFRDEGLALHAQAGAWTGDADVVAVAIEPTTGWQIWQIVSRDDTLQPMRQARTQALQNAVGYAVVLAAGLFVFLVWQLRPLIRLEARAVQLMAGDGDEHWPVADGEIGKLTRTLRHVWAERAQVERFNADVLQKLSSVMAAAPVGLAFTRHQRFELVSAEFCRLVGRAEDELLGHLTQLIYASNEDYLAIGPQVRAAFEAGAPYVGDWQLLRRDASVFWARLHARAVDLNDAAAGTIWSVYDITDQMDVRARLEHAAAHDPLTGVQNRKGFERAIGAVFETLQGRRPACLLMIDLDDFKPVNDSAGHAAGDAMLKVVAQALLAHVRATDTVARLGGDEFAVLLPGCDHERACTIAQNLLQAITGAALPWGGRTLRVGASIGVAAMAASHTDASQWLADADAACYAAKRGGRGTVRSAAAQVGLKLVMPGSGR